MPHLKSAKKRMRQNAKRRENNRATMKALRKNLKLLTEISKEKEAAPDALKKQATVTIKKLDKAAARRVIHPNMAARKKSQIARLLTAKSKPAPAAAPAK